MYKYGNNQNTADGGSSSTRPPTLVEERRKHPPPPPPPPKAAPPVPTTPSSSSTNAGKSLVQHIWMGSGPTSLSYTTPDQQTHQQHQQSTTASPYTVPSSPTAFRQVNTNDNNYYGMVAHSFSSSNEMISSPRITAAATTTTTTPSSSSSRTLQHRHQYQYQSNPGQQQGIFIPASPTAVPKSPSVLPKSPRLEVLSSSSAILSSSSSPTQQQAKQQQQQQKYQHNTIMSFFLVPIIVIILLSHNLTYSRVPIHCFLVSCLMIYTFDLANQRDGVYYTLWVSVIVNTLVSAWYWLIAEDDTTLSDGSSDDESGWYVIEIIFKVGTTAIVYIIMACWITVHMEDDNNNNITDETNILMTNSDVEALLHSIVPPLFAAYMCQWLTTNVVGSFHDSETAAIIAPHLFAILLLISMVFIGSCQRSFNNPVTTKTNNNTIHNVKEKNPNLLSSAISNYSIRDIAVVRIHILLLLITPCCMHLTTCGSRLLFSSNSTASWDDWYDFILTITIPYLLLHAIQILPDISNNSNDNSTTNNKTTTIYMNHPYKIQSNLGSGGSIFKQLFFRIGIDNSNKMTTTVGHNLISFLPFASVCLLTSLILQHRYLIPVCRAFSYHFQGIVSTSTWILSLYWTTATISIICTFWLWGRVSLTVMVATEGSTTIQPQLIFGEYQDDIVQIGLSFAGLCLGKSFGLPWNLTPLPVLAVLGLALWVTSRMLRYLTIFLFVWHASAVVVFTYRFVGISQSITLSTFPITIDVSLLHFGLVITSTSIMVGMMTGLAVRSNGGFMASIMKQADFTGVVFIVYVLMLAVLEVTLLNHTLATRELVGVETEEIDEEDAILYDPFLVYVTSLTIIGITIFMRRVRILKKITTSIIISLAIGKAVAVFVDSEGVKKNYDSRGNMVLMNVLVVAFLCLVIYAPRIFLEPVYLKVSVRYKRSLSGGSELPKGTVRTILLYTFFLLPLTLILTIPYVLFPLVDILAGGNSYYTVKTPLSELIGSVIALWGLSCMSMMNYYLPDGGGEVWKKLSAFSFLMGLTIFFAAPTLGTGMQDVTSNPYASLSSVGSQMIRRSKSRTGGWGLLVAGLSTLLAVTGPLELKERHVAGGKDKTFIFRIMIFSMMFGGGVTWFITVQSMSDTQWLFLMVMMVASMTVAFLGTFAIVLGYLLDLQKFGEVEQMAKTCVFAFGAFTLLAGVPQLLGFFSGQKPLGAGGWLSSYFIVTSITSIFFAMAVSWRTSKDSRTKSCGNIACCISWILAVVVLYGRFGIAGLDSTFEVRTLMGLPLSVLGTVAISPILLILEGEKSEARGRRVSVSTHQRKSGALISLSLPQLKSSNRWFLPFFGTVSVLLLTSLYVVLLRGCAGSPSIAQSHEDVFAKVFGSPMSSVDHDLASLAQKASSHSMVLTASAKLAGSGFWTSSSFFGPFLHLFGIGACLPTLFLLIKKWWWDISVHLNLISFSLPLNVIPLLLCRGIPGLRVAALANIIACVHLIIAQRREEEYAKTQM